MEQALLRVSPTGQITLPRPVRFRFGLDAGGYLQLEINADGAIVLRRVQITVVSDAQTASRDFSERQGE